jgi:hypothetical protein
MSPNQPLISYRVGLVGNRTLFPAHVHWLSMYRRKVKVPGSEPGSDLIELPSWDPA